MCTNFDHQLPLKDYIRSNIYCLTILLIFWRLQIWSIEGKSTAIGDRSDEEVADQE